MEPDHSPKNLTLKTEFGIVTKTFGNENKILHFGESCKNVVLTQKQVLALK